MDGTTPGGTNFGNELFYNVCGLSALGEFGVILVAPTSISRIPQFEIRYVWHADFTPITPPLKPSNTVVNNFTYTYVLQPIVNLENSVFKCRQHTANIL